MSTYVVRIIEVRRPNYKKVVWKDPKNLVPEEYGNEEIFKVRFQGESTFYRCIEINGKKQLTGIEHPGYHWETLTWYRNANSDSYCDINDDSIIKLRDENGNEISLTKNDHFVDNGGFIRDKYLARYYNPFKLAERGWPNDITTESAEQCHKYCWGKTYVMLNEYLRIIETEKKNFINEIKETKINSDIKLINEKLDAIKFGYSTYPSKNEEEEECYEDSIEYLCNEGLLSEIESLENEITKVWSLVDEIYGYVSEDDIRILYYFE